MSGLSHYPGKVAQGQPCREFESLALRQRSSHTLNVTYVSKDGHTHSQL